MGTVIRMKRGGRTHRPYYRVVVMDSRTRTRGRVIDQIGFYHPCARPEPLSEIDTVKALSWLKKGARLSNTVRDVFSKKGIMAVHAGDAKLEDILPPEPVAEAADPVADTAESVADTVEPVEVSPESAADTPTETTTDTEPETASDDETAE